MQPKPWHTARPPPSEPITACDGELGCLTGGQAVSGRAEHSGQTAGQGAPPRLGCRGARVLSLRAAG